ncbi:MAG: HAD-IIIC family phosphatase [Chloroflexi bacterium]|nr:HAD-IIIC family phosphatase [Chloroflexota bacterium]
MTSSSQTRASPVENDSRTIKCVVWDLDNTLWNGILVEDEAVTINQNVIDVIKQLDSRGIVNSIASKNENDLAWAKLVDFGLAEYFVFPEINWNSKAQSILAIAANMNIGLDAISFVDDDAFELEEVRFTHPSVLCIESDRIEQILDMPMMNPRFVTSEAKARRAMYVADAERTKSELAFQGSSEEFLSSLNMVLTIRDARDEDLERAAELVLRTHQLNTTGYAFSFNELDAFRTSPSHRLLVSSLEDRFGSYGTIGVALVHCGERVWTIRLLLMSCRVMSRGVGTIVLNHVIDLARAAGTQLRAEFVPNERNRMMYVSLRFNGFREEFRQGDRIVLHRDMSAGGSYPEYVTLKLGNASDTYGSAPASP